MAKTKYAHQYPVTLGYKERADLDGDGHAEYLHFGIDNGCPIGTPVLVNDTVIALSGNTGFSTGAHLHRGKFVRLGRYWNWLYHRVLWFNPKGSEKITGGGRVVFTGEMGGYGTVVVIKRKTTLLRPLPTFYIYCHLKKYSVKVKAGDWV